MQILIADDQRTSRKILDLALKKFGHDVLAVDNGEEAWAIMREPDAPRLAILDWMMPGMDGVDVCRRIRARETDDPPYLILLTARDDVQSVVEGLDAGANDYLTKPYKSEELNARIRVGQRMLDLQADLIQAREALVYEAMHDALTNVFNRRAILEGLSREISRTRRKTSGLSIGLCDLDFFKKVNDQYGHQVGDDMLVGFTGILRSNLRDFDLLGRYGGEEFLVVAPGSEGTREEGIYERLRAAVAETEIPTRSGGLRITMSVGVATWKGVDSMDELLAAADAALYRAKDQGRNRVVYAEE